MCLIYVTHAGVYLVQNYIITVHLLLLAWWYTIFCIFPDDFKVLHEWVDIQSNPDSAALKVKLEGDSSFLSKILFVLGGEAHDAMEVNGDTAIEHTAVFPADMDGKCGGDYTIRFLDIFSCQVMDDLTITRSKLSIQCIKSVIITFIKFSTNIYKIHINISLL